MAAELILEFEGVTEKEYFAVNKELGTDPETGDGDWPDGLGHTRPDSTRTGTSW